MPTRGTVSGPLGASLVPAADALLRLEASRVASGRASSPALKSRAHAASISGADGSYGSDMSASSSARMSLLVAISLRVLVPFVSGRAVNLSLVSADIIVVAAPTVAPSSEPISLSFSVLSSVCSGASLRSLTCTFLNHFPPAIRKLSMMGEKIFRTSRGPMYFGTSLALKAVCLLDNGYSRFHFIADSWPPIPPAEVVMFFLPLKGSG